MTTNDTQAAILSEAQINALDAIISSDWGNGFEYPNVPTIEIRNLIASHRAQSAALAERDAAWREEHRELLCRHGIDEETP